MGNPLRILHVVVNMNRGGAETLIMNLYRNINRTKVQFDFLTFKEGAFDEEIIRMGGKIYRIPYITDTGPIRFTQKLTLFFRENPGYKVVHSHMDKMSGLILKAAKKAHIPIRIAHSHNTESEGGFFSKAYKWYAGNYILPSATHLYACSNKAAKWLFKGKAIKAHILKNGIETDKFQFSTDERELVRKELGIAKNAFVLGHVGRFSEQKNHLFLLDVFSLVHKVMPNTELVLVGDGPLRQEIEKRVTDLNIAKKVKLLGIRSDIDRLLHAFDLFVFPSLHEGLPVTLIEAQGAGLPCLISNTITREVDMGIGLVQYMPIRDQEDWVRKISNLQNFEQSRKVAEAALMKKGYDIRSTAKQTEASYITLGETAI